MFDDFDVTSFWKDSTYGKKAYVCRPPTSEVVASVELSLKYKLPASYVELMRFQNGGLPKNTYHRTKAPTSWAEDHVAITGIFSIGKERQYSLCGELGSQFWIEEWGYPAIGIYFADCPSAGHDMLCLDFRECGPDGEPTVVHVDQELDYRVTQVARSFEVFVRGLEGDESFPDG